MKMTFLFIRIFFIVGSILVGFQIGQGAGNGMLGAMISFAVAFVIIALEGGMRHFSVRGLSSVVFGFALGLVMATFISYVLSLFPLLDKETLSTVRVILILVFCYLCTVAALRGRDEFNLVIPYIRFSRRDQRADAVILDTSAVIDGRIVDIYKTGFINARLLAPRFVLRELQQLADSSDSMKRQRGRRGLEILHTMQKDSAVDISIPEQDFLELKGADAKLVRLAKIFEAKILTLDFNLNRVATLQDIGVLNINDLANALKSVVFAGERFELKLIKEGKEYNQAIGYLEDGTMVVVEDARKHIGRLTGVVVTSVLQTQAGKMIFTKLDHEATRK